MNKRIPKTFVAFRFQPLASLIFPEIGRMWYMVDQETKEEFVVVEYDETYNKESKRIGHFQICVTGDSPCAMVSDIWNGLLRRFA